MNREDAIKLANDMAFMASIWVDDKGNEVNDLVKFAKLVAAKERNEILKMCEPPEHSHQFVHTFKKLIAARGEA